MEIQLPNGWDPRPYQMPLWNYLENGGKRAVAVWHRRAGKDSLSLNWTATQAMQKTGVYWHMAPTQKQVRKIVWDNIDKQGRRIIDQVFPPEIRAKKNDTEMRIELINGSIWQCVGSDNYNSLVGANPSGVVFSEYSLADPSAWDYIRPILAENGGWALFIYTPRGRNHGWEIYDMARQNPDWFAQALSVEDTNAIPLWAIDDERKAGMDEDRIQQEFYVSFDSAMPGAYYAKLLSDADREGRITNVPYEPRLPVIVAWDLGVHDHTSLWFFQHLGREVRAIDYYENSGEGLEHYVKILNSKTYIYGNPVLPHDVAVKELGTGKTRLEILQSLGVRCSYDDILPRGSVADRIQAVRSTLPITYFDAKKCHRGIEALRNYHRDYDDKLKVYKSTPAHDWSSHAADSFGYGCQGIKPPRTPSRNLPQFYETGLKNW